MKTNKTRKVLIALLAVISIFSFAASAFAQTEAVSKEETSAQAETAKKPSAQAEKPGKKDGKHRHGHPVRFDADRFEDWFEDRIDARKHNVDFSQLPENPTDEEMLDFFRKNFLSEAPEQNCNSKPEHPMKKNRKADRFEDWFEDRIDAREYHVDFSQLGDNPTDEEIVEFFRTNFLGKQAK